MYDLALSVSACLRSKTRADIAWPISPGTAINANPSQALALTPGGGRIGALFDGAFDSHFVELTSRQLAAGRKIEIEITEFESTISGLPTNVKAEFLVMPGTGFPDEFWPAMLNREAIALACHIEDNEVVSTDFFTAQTISTADPKIMELFNKGTSTVVEFENQVVTIYWPVTKLVVAGTGPIADLLVASARMLGWQVAVESRFDMVTGLMAGLSKMDCAVIMGHDVESSSKCLAAALESDAGYIGALGSKQMQENRADWLAYRDIFDLSRVHGPAGFDIGAKTPGEIAVSILAQAIGVLNNV